MQKGFAKVCGGIALLAALTSGVWAEESGGFFGVDVARGLANQTIELKTKDGDVTGSYKNLGLKGPRLGFISGYKHFFTPKFGIRGYGSFNYGAFMGGDKRSDEDVYMGALSIGANVDVMYNFCDCDGRIFGAYAGVNLGYIDYHVQDVGSVEGIDMGLTFGFRAVFNERHSFEIYRRFARGVEFPVEFVDKDGKASYQRQKIVQPDTTGIRYVYNF
ncbi:hypothetical protein DMB95_03615 [Campylobacter sp. MIT 12-8780]|uniref:outer membrane beta-barrel protein n=1 Tax=unclassified Campylobacter TaxID=2593542 RepID=UPI00115E4553|nr:MULTISPECIES: outer membrane beta-barrel protein [unclassified Campylobacter]NDJ26848.1 outer membrane beta-barrel protein [Campylobacter sp. MIT 19-121]TQR42006.1 hypothetical protein DMB95_03615 [Campylobacter sp. MIT 12-8780]